MASYRILRHTVLLSNYVGEVNDVATYQVTVLRHCYCPADEGISVGSHGKQPNDNSTLYIFDYRTVAESENGIPRKYLPYQEWKKLTDKTPYWTLSDRGEDFFHRLDGHTDFRINGFSHKVIGTRRMWHFEVSGK